MPPISVDPFSATQEPAGTPWYEELDSDPVPADFAAMVEGRAPEPGQPAAPTEETVRQALSGGRPTVPPAPELTLELPRGYTANGITHTTVEVRELTGADEEYLARYKTDETVFDAIIALAVQRIGTIDLSNQPVSESSRILGTLLIGERLMIFLKVIEVTFGNEKEMRYTCGSCGEEQDLTVLINEDFQINVPENLQMVYDFTLSSGKVVKYRLLVGADVLAISENAKATVAQTNTAMLSRIIVSVDGETPLDMADFVRKLSIGDRERLLKDVAQNQPDVALSLSLTCLSCHEEVQAPVTWGQLFRV